MTVMMEDRTGCCQLSQRSIRKKRVVIVFVLTLFAVLFLLQHAWYRKSLLDVIESKTTSKVVLMWTDFNTYTDTDDGWFSGRGMMKMCQRSGVLRPDQTCEFTADRSRILGADAVIFRGKQLSLSDLPIRRLPSQQYVVYEREPPHKIWKFVNLTEFNGFFNLTSTYSYDSDIPINPNKHFMLDEKKFAKLEFTDFSATKRSDVPVAWFVSQCQTQSRREDYVRAMRRHIAVDVYGNCGNLSCPRKLHTGFKSDHCVWDLLHGTNSYKFYLSFENGLCDDYISEKLWKVMGARVVPVVMGKASYDKIFPPGSYIDVRDFSSPRHLAEYLKYLNTHNDAYNQYLRTKGSMRLAPAPHQTRECVLCKGLHELTGQPRVVHRLDTFWGSRRCASPYAFFRHKNPGEF